jgi:hypothetical protein
MVNSIAVVLNVYKRVELLTTQIEAISKQSITPSTIYIWNNSGNKIILHFTPVLPIFIIDANHNFGVWARFSFALNLKETFVALIDDDTIPGEKWFENCLNHIGDGKRLLGTRGLRFLSNNNYSPYESFGWDSPNDQLVEVDIIGHSWFFKRTILGTFWRYYDHRYNDDFCGEDIHFSFSIQQLGLKSFVPPHKSGYYEEWGSDPNFAKTFGTAEVAISSSPKAISKFTDAYRHYLQKGFITYYMRNDNPAKLIIKSNFRENEINIKISKFPLLYRILKKVKKYLNKIGIFF